MSKWDVNTTIPQDWHEGDGWCMVRLCIPNSDAWRATVKGVIGLLKDGRTWRSDGPRKSDDPNAIEIVDVQRIGRAIYESVCVSCNWEALEQQKIAANLLLYSAITGQTVDLDIQNNPVFGRDENDDPISQFKLDGTSVTAKSPYLADGPIGSGGQLNIAELYARTMFSGKLWDLMPLSDGMADVHQRRLKEIADKLDNLLEEIGEADQQEIIRQLSLMVNAQQSMAEQQTIMGEQQQLIARGTSGIVGAILGAVAAIRSITLKVPDITPGLSAISGALNKISMTLGAPAEDDANMWDWFMGYTRPKNMLELLSCLLVAKNVSNQIEGGVAPTEGCDPNDNT